jgi:hypothetical protein
MNDTETSEKLASRTELFRFVERTIAHWKMLAK